MQEVSTMYSNDTDQVPVSDEQRDAVNKSSDDEASQPASRHSNHPVLAAYIREVSKESLLSREEETELFTTLRSSRDVVSSLIQRLDHLLDKAQSRVVNADTLRYEEVSKVWEALPLPVQMQLPAEARRRLRRHLRTWKTARDRLLKSNLRLVIYTVKRFRNEPSMFMDLIQEGNIGLMRAVDRYDPNRSSRFSTYALWWIWQAVNRAYAKNVYTIRVPVYKVQQVGRYHRRRRRSRPALIAPRRTTRSPRRLACRPRRRSR